MRIYNYLHLLNQNGIAPSCTQCYMCLQVMTPFLTAKLAGQYVAVDAVGLFMSTLQVIFLSCSLAALLNYCNLGHLSASRVSLW